MKIERLDKFRIVEKYSFFPFIRVKGHIVGYYYTGKWFKHVKVKQQKIRKIHQLKLEYEWWFVEMVE